MSEARGTWYNQHGSELELEVDGEGRVTGRFRTGVGTPAPVEEFEVRGFCWQELVAFVVDFGRYHCLTAWVGHVVSVQGRQGLDSMWQMTVRVPGKDEARRVWRGVWSGADLFMREPHAAERGRTPSHPTRVGGHGSHPEG